MRVSAHGALATAIDGDQRERQGDERGERAAAGADAAAAVLARAVGRGGDADRTRDRARARGTRARGGRVDAFLERYLSEAKSLTVR